ncbi:MAG TPA: ABC transporter ATP-binding protein [Bacteroidota bacterium]|nr:ABC transporter ATP-binding protein [Bacteroidota bacterium]
MKILLRLKPYLLKYKHLYIIGFLATIVSNISGIIVPLIIRNAIDSLSKNVQLIEIIKTSLLIVFVSIIAGVCLFLTRRTIIVASRKIEYDLRNDFFSHLLKLDLKYFQNTSTGDLMAHATNDINAVRNFLGPAILYSSDTIVAFIMITAIMISINSHLTIISFIPLPFISIFVYLIASSVNKKFEKVQSQYSLLTSKAQESISGIRVVKSFVREQNEIKLFGNISKEYFNKNMKLVKVHSLMFPLMVLFIGISIVLVIWFGGRMVINDKLTLGNLTAFIIYLGWLIWPMIAFGWVANLVQQSAASMKRLAKILDTEPEVENSNNKLSVTELHGDILLKDVYFRYSKNSPDIIKGINLNIKAGTSLAIIGRTGSGKTTLVNLINRLYDVTKGSIHIDGVNIKDLPIETIRQNIGYVTQETFLFSTTIKENIIYGINTYNEEDFKKAVDIAQIDKDVRSFPDSYDTIIGERGITLSGGQKQRVSIARAIMKKPKILILDDALSAVDTYTEEEILKRLRNFMENRTCILISHRISTIKDADLIVVLDNGIIVESGSHKELIEIGGIYYELYQKQLLEEEIEEIE